jgi:toxin ParE1/3/4
MTYRLAQAALNDLQRIYDYGLESWGEAAADSYYNALFDRFEEIASRPLFYPAVEHIRKGYRRSVCGVDSIYYRVGDDDGIVEIMAILGSQDTDEALKP